MSTNLLRQNRNEIIQSYKNGASTCELGRKYNVANALVYKFLRDECHIVMHKQPKYEDYIEQIKQLHSEGISAYEIAKQTGISQQTVQRYAAKIGLNFDQHSKHREDLLLNHTQEIIEKYNSGIGCYKLSKEYNCGECSILNLLKRNNIVVRPLRSLKVDETYFEKIDTEHKAYYLGFLIGDGCNRRTSFSISITDLEIVKKFKKDLNTDTEIRILQPRGKAVKLQYLLRVSSKKMCDDLTKLGCMPAKTFQTKLPTENQVPKHLMNHWLRGLLDADGTISYYKNRNSYQVGYIGSPELINEIKDYINKELNILGNTFIANKTSSVLTWQLSKNQYIYDFLNYLYKDSTIHLTRKYERYQDFLQKYSQMNKTI